MTHRAIEIINAFRTALGSLETTGSNVKVSRAFTTSKFPALSIYIGANPLQSILSNSIAQRTLTLKVAIHVSGNPELFDNQFLQIESEIWKSIMQDEKLGLGYVIECMPQGLGEPQTSLNDEVPSAAVESLWQITYRHSVVDPEN